MTDQHIEITGNPFVDVGFAIAASIAKQRSLSDASFEHVASAVNVLHEATDGLKDLKILSAFWVNNPFMGKNLGQKPKFKRYLNDLGNQRLAAKRGYCQICGRSPVIGRADRCWFPLAASGESDPCTLPGLRGKAICSGCLSAAIVLPLGCRFCREGPYIMHVAEPDLQVEAVSEGVQAVRTSLAAKTSEPLMHNTSLAGRIALLEIICGNVLWDHTQPGHMSRLPQSGTTIISFNNSGNKPLFHELHLPAQALEFFGAITEAGVQGVFLTWVKQGQNFASRARRQDYNDQLCDGVESRFSLAPLLAAMIKERKNAQLRREERQVLQIYEDIALKKKERFDTLERIAAKVKDMRDPYRESFVKQLANIGSKERFLELVKQFCKAEKLAMTNAEIRVIDYGPPSEIISLLYLLCTTDE